MTFGKADSHLLLAASLQEACLGGQAGPVLPPGENLIFLNSFAFLLINIVGIIIVKIMIMIMIVVIIIMIIMIRLQEQLETSQGEVQRLEQRASDLATQVD